MVRTHEQLRRTQRLFLGGFLLSLAFLVIAFMAPVREGIGPTGPVIAYEPEPSVTTEPATVVTTEPPPAVVTPHTPVTVYYPAAPAPPPHVEHSEAAQPSSGGSVVLSSAMWPVVLAGFSAISSLITLGGLVLTTLVAWRKERREAQLHSVELDIKRAELEKMQRELGQGQQRPKQ